MDQYEYVVVEGPSRLSVRKGARYDDMISAKLNEVAAHGWRLHSSTPGSKHGGEMFTFERKKE